MASCVIIGDVRVTRGVCVVPLTTKGHMGELSCRFIVRESGAADRRWRGDSQRPIVTYRSMAGRGSPSPGVLGFVWMRAGQMAAKGVHVSYVIYMHVQGARISSLACAAFRNCWLSMPYQQCFRRALAG